jgi:hypothetical protein
VSNWKEGETLISHIKELGGFFKILSFVYWDHTHNGYVKEKVSQFSETTKWMQIHEIAQISIMLIQIFPLEF